MEKPKKEINTTDYDVSEDAPEFFDMYDPDVFMEAQQDIVWSSFYD